MSMESKLSKKEAIKEYKERKPRRGIFAVRCSAVEQVWVGSSLNLDATRNSLWFRFRLGGRQYPDLQQAWNEHGESAFTYEVLEMLKDDVLPMAVRDLLKEKLNAWAGKLQALTLLG
jgi:hypothetical protein